MIHRFVSLSEFFGACRERHEPLVLATLIHTIGSTYRKSGAQMLLAADGSAVGLLSGGCLEADLMERARKVLDTGEAAIAEYDTRSSDDLIWGMGLGCEGAMRILLTQLHAGNDYQPFAYIDRCRREHVAAGFVLVTASNNPAFKLGDAYWSEAAAGLPFPIQSALESAARRGVNRAERSVLSVDADNASFLIAPVELPIRLLVLGAGPDAMPLVEIAGMMGWQVTVLDHRPAYAVGERFPRAQRVSVSPATALASVLGSAHYDAAVVMSHHLTSDEAYLRALADSTIPYIGLLGPAPRRARLLSDIGDKAQGLGDRLHGPIGLDIGANSPETIALAIVGEIQAVLAGRHGGSFNSPASAVGAYADASRLPQTPHSR
jgi:xanthine/CO dehydrogenase XdhC/CoxF family maturation factor